MSMSVEERTAKALALKAQITVLEREIRERDTKMRELRAEYNALVSPFAIGDLIEFGLSRRQRARVVGFRTGWLHDDQPDLIVVNIRKDGEEGMKHRVSVSYTNPVRIEE